jgi:hypothetical protein
MRKRQELTRGARFSNARAKALRAAKAAKKKVVQGPKIKKLSSPTAQQAGDKLMDTFKKLSKVDNEAPISRTIVEENPSTENKKFLGFIPVGTFTSRGNRR